MSTSPDQRELSPTELNAADQAFELLSDLSADEAERVLANVHARLNQPKIEVEDEDRVMFSRGMGSPFGKLVCVVKSKLDEPTFDLFLKLCTEHRTDVASILRDCVYTLVYGKTCEQMLVDRIKHGSQPTESLARSKGPFGGPESMS